MRYVFLALLLLACDAPEPGPDASIPGPDAAPDFGDCLLSLDVSALSADGPNQATSRPVFLPGPARALVVSSDESPEASVSLVQGDVIALVVPPGVDFLDGESGDMTLMLETGPEFAGSIAISEATIGFDCP